jgi:hypothetical protein
MTVLGEGLVVALAVMAAIGGLVAVAYFLWLVLIDVKRTAAGRAQAPGVRVVQVHVLHHARR